MTADEIIHQALCRLAQSPSEATKADIDALMAAARPGQVEYVQVQDEAFRTHHALPQAYHLGFDVTKAESGAWVLSEYTLHTGVWHHYTCADSEALCEQVQAWADRLKIGIRDDATNREREAAGPHLIAAREVSA
jgi:hypothetical protein